MASYQAELLKDFDDRSLTGSDLEATVKEFELETSYQHTSTRRTRTQSLFFTLFSVLKALVGFASFIILLLILRETHSLLLRLPDEHAVQQNDRWYCGRNSTTARAKGCRFDVMLTTWLHEDCFYEDLMESYLAAHNFTWSSDTSFTNIVPEDVIRRGDHRHIFVQPEFHYIHCAYTWDMQLLAFHNGRPLVESLADPEHSRHCSKLLIDHVLPRNETSLTVVGELCTIPEPQQLPDLESFSY